MKVLDPGHHYSIECYPCNQARKSSRHNLPSVAFVKKTGLDYPGNEEPPLDGTNCQEMFRVLIDRVTYLDGQKPCPQNKAILMHLRTSLYLLEFRAAELK